MIRTRSVTLVLALTLSACGGSSKSAPPPAEPAAPSPAEKAPEPEAAPVEHGAACVEGDEPASPMLTKDEAETMGLAIMEEMGTVFEQNATDCKALAAAIQKWVRDHCTLLLRMKAFAATQTAADKEAFDAKYNDKMMAIGMKMMPAMQNCANDPDVHAAMESIPQ
jgi:hypothetical protein